MSFRMLSNISRPVLQCRRHLYRPIQQQCCRPMLTQNLMSNSSVRFSSNWSIVSTFQRMKHFLQSYGTVFIVVKLSSAPPLFYMCYNIPSLFGYETITDFIRSQGKSLTQLVFVYYSFQIWWRNGLILNIIWLNPTQMLNHQKWSNTFEVVHRQLELNLILILLRPNSLLILLEHFWFTGWIHNLFGQFRNGAGVYTHGSWTVKQHGIDPDKRICYCPSEMALLFYND